MFEDATFHSSSAIPNQTPKWMLLALAFNLSVLSALVALPLIYPQGLPARLLERALYAPAPPLAAQPQPRTTQPAAAQALAIRNLFTVPTKIPTTTRIDIDAPPPAQTMGDLNPGADLVPGGVGNAASVFPTNPPQVVHPPQPQRLTISAGVIEGLLVSRSTPIYPPIAMAARISGTVVLAATIAKSGAIQNLRVLSGPAMLLWMQSRTGATALTCSTTSRSRWKPPSMLSFPWGTVRKPGLPNPRGPRKCRLPSRETIFPEASGLAVLSRSCQPIRFTTPDAGLLFPTPDLPLRRTHSRYADRRVGSMSKLLTGTFGKQLVSFSC
jgi:periplasmic protein TonB